MGGKDNKGDKKKAKEQGDKKKKLQIEQARKIREARLKKEQEQSRKKGKVDADRSSKSSAKDNKKGSPVGSDRDKQAAQRTTDKSKTARAMERLNKAESAIPKNHVSYPRDRVTGYQLEVQRNKDGTITNVIDMMTGRKDSTMAFADHVVDVDRTYAHLPPNERRFLKLLDQLSRDSKEWEKTHKVEPGSEKTRLRDVGEQQSDISPELRLNLDLGRHPWGTGFFMDGRLFLPDAKNKDVKWINFWDIPEGATHVVDGKLDSLDKGRGHASDHSMNKQATILELLGQRYLGGGGKMGEISKSETAKKKRGPDYWVYKKGIALEVLPHYPEERAEILDFLRKGKPLVDRFGDPQKKSDERSVERLRKVNIKLNTWTEEFLKKGESLTSARAKVKEKALAELKSVISSEVLTLVMGMADGFNMSIPSGTFRGTGRRIPRGRRTQSRGRESVSRKPKTDSRVTADRSATSVSDNVIRHQEYGLQRLSRGEKAPDNLPKKTVVEFPSGLRAWRDPLDPNVIHHEGVIGSPVKGKNLQDSALPRIKDTNLGPDYERLHTLGPGTGAESPYGILYGPKKINRALQNDGIEEMLRGLHKELRTNVSKDVKLHIVTETKCHPGSNRLKEVVYRVDTSYKGSRERLFEFGIQSHGPINGERIDIPKEWLRVNDANHLKDFLLHGVDVQERVTARINRWRSRLRSK